MENGYDKVYHVRPEKSTKDGGYDASIHSSLSSGSIAIEGGEEKKRKRGYRRCFEL